MQGIIYKATNLINGKVYIGQTTRSLHSRISAHKKSKRAFGKAIQKYGIENFRIAIIDKAEDKSGLDNKETFWINFYKSMGPQGYNLTSGGDTTEFSIESRLKMSENAKKRLPEYYGNFLAAANSPESMRKKAEADRSPVTRAKKAASAKVRVFTLETRAKKSESGKNISPDRLAKFQSASKTPEARAKNLAANKDKNKFTPEVRAKMSLGRKGKKHTPEARAKMSESHKNISEETRARMSESAKRRKRTAMSEETRAKISKKAKSIMAELGSARLPVKAVALSNVAESSTSRDSHINTHIAHKKAAGNTTNPAYK